MGELCRYGAPRRHDSVKPCSLYAGTLLLSEMNSEDQIMQEHEYIKVIDRVHITTAIDQLQKIRPSQSIGGISETDLKEIIIKLKEWEEELFRVVEVIPDV